MRLFIAIPPDDAVRRGLIRLQDALRRQGMGGNFTPPENLHLTLAFLGEYHDPDRVLEIMEDVSFRPFPLRLEGFGHFGALWWAGLAPNGELSSCVRSLRHALADGKIPFDRKKFTPHITLVRRAVTERDRLPAVSVPPVEMTAGRIALLRSDRGKNGMIYTELGAVSGTE